jgi:transcriptional regulator with XRE-family HTH domain
MLRKLSQDYLDELAGLSANYTNRLEKGHRNPTVGTLEVLANALGVTAEDLVRRSTPKKKGSPKKT